MEVGGGSVEAFMEVRGASMEPPRTSMETSTKAHGGLHRVYLLCVLSATNENDFRRLSVDRKCKTIFYGFRIWNYTTVRLLFSY